MKLCDTVILVPLSFCTYNVSTIFNGLVYYNQWSRLYWWQIFFVTLGICILLCGVLILSWRRSTAPEEELFVAGEDRMLLGHNIEGLTELYEEENFDKYTENINHSDRCFLGGDPSNTKIITFEEMLQDENVDEKTSLLGKRKHIR